MSVCSCSLWSKIVGLEVWDIPQLVSDEIFCWKLAYWEPRSQNCLVLSIHGEFYPLPGVSQSKVLMKNHCIWSHCELLLPWTKFSHAPQQQQRAAALRTGWWEKKLISALCTFWRQNVNQCDDGLDSSTSEWIMLLHHWKRSTYSISFGYISISTIYIILLIS